MAVCVAGSHRSGTSMLARVLQLCGVYLGPDDELMEPAPDNPGGFWENERFVELNDRLLNEYGGGWDCPPPATVDWQDAGLGYLRSSAERLVERFEEHDPWGWKDPRNSVTLPFWQDVVPDLKVVVSLRNPLDVAASLRRRNGSTYALGLTLWLRYNAQLVAATSAEDRIVTHYDAYFTDPEREVRRVLEFLEIDAPDDVVDGACQTVSAEWRHHQTGESRLVDAHVAPEILDLYASLCDEAAWEPVAQLRERMVAAAAGVAVRERGRGNGTTRTRGTNGSGNGSGNGSARGGTRGNADIEPSGRLEEAVVKPASLGRELAELRGNFARQTEAVARLVDELSRKNSVDERALKALERRQQGALDELGERIGELEGALEEAGREHERQIAEVSDICQYLLSQASVLEELTANVVGGDDVGLRRERLRLAAAIHAATPPHARVIVVGSEGPEMTKLVAAREIRYLPQSPDGLYLERHPAASSVAVAHLEALRADGADFLAFPEPALWWGRRYPEFWTYLERRYATVWERDGSGVIFALRPSRKAPKRAWETKVEGAIREFRARFDRDPSVLDWTEDGVLAAAFPELAVFSPDEAHVGRKLPYLSDSVDVVAVSGDRSATEARRVASVAVLALDSDADGETSVTVRWKQATRKRSSVTSASVVIPSWNGIEHTEKCVIALSETLPGDYDCEIVVVDDCSTDDTQERLAVLAADEPRLKVVRNEENSGFILTCNRGAAESRGDYVIMLNNDTVPLHGWLEPLLAIFRHYPDAGASTGKLVFPDGTLQEAGGVIFSDARGANFGKWDENPEDPLYNYVREVDYGSGALLAAPRKLWNEIGGFDTLYRPIYCDDSDFCFKIRQRGLKVYYQPECVVVHVEGATSGRDESKGDKRYQVVNTKKFARRWRKELRRQRPYPNGFGRDTLHDIVVREELVPVRRGAHR